MLPDPNEPSAKFLNRSLQPLATTEAHRARILLAEPGMGKTHELNAEVERLRKTGSFVATINLGGFSDGSDLRDEFVKKDEEWRASGTNEMVLALDSFDEPLPYIGALADIISRRLEAIGPDRLRVLVASRTSLWDSSLEAAFKRWWGTKQITRLTLAPLTEADVKLAAASDVDDPDEFLRDVVDRGAAAFAARPVTLGLLLAVARENDLPRTRTGIYAQGIRALLTEPSTRRQAKRRRGEPALAQKVVQAHRLAAVTLLTGRQLIVRGSTGSPAREVTLDMLAEDDVILGTLESVWDSALLSGHPEGRTWSHRTIEEYLAAEQLARIPLQAAIRLLTVPGDQTRLVPQFQEAAAWLAWLSPEADAFDWLIRHHPQTVITADLRAADQAVRAKVAKAVIDNLRSNTPLRRRDGYDALAFDGLGELVRPLLDDEEPGWRQHEALMIIAATQIRSVDDRLIELVEKASHGGPSRADEDVDIARAAAYALSGTHDPDIHTRLRTVLGEAEAPASVRALLLKLFWPDVIKTSELLDLVEPEHRFAFENLRYQAIYTFRTAVDDGRVAAGDLVDWFRGATGALHEEVTADLAARASLDVINSVDRPSARWEAAVDLADRLLTATRDRVPWSTGDVSALGDTRRRRLARDLLLGSQDGWRAEAFRYGGLIRQDDLGWWFDMLAADLADGGPDDGLSARVVLDILIDIADPEHAARTEREAVNRHPVLTSVTEVLFAPAIVENRQARRQQAAQRSLATQVPHPRSGIDKSAFAASVTAGGFAALLEVINLGCRVSGFAGADKPIEGWQALNESERDTLAAAALSFLQHEHTDDERDIGWLSGRAHDILWARLPKALAQVTGVAWLSLLPHLLPAPENQRVIAYALRAAARHDRAATVRIVTRHIQAEVEKYGRVYVGGPLGDFRDTEIAVHALRLTAEPDVPPRAVEGLLTLGFTMTTDSDVLVEAVTITRTLVAACPGEPPADEDRDDEARAAWSRAVAAIVAVMPRFPAPELFNEVVALFRQAPELFVDVVRPNRSRELFAGLTSSQITELFLWAHHQFPPRRVQPGVMISRDSVEEAVGYLPDLLRKRRDHEAIDALEAIATALSDVHLAAEAARLRDEVRVSEHVPMSPEKALEILNDPQRWSITTTTDLAGLILQELDKLQHDLHHDRALRTQVWHRQRHDNNWAGHVPVEEIEFSTWLSHQLKSRLGGHIALLREVQIQPHLGHNKADHPDIVAVTIKLATGEQVQLPIEVKCNWHDRVLEDLSDQLINRYLNGPLGAEGIYIVGHFHNDQWPDEDGNRRRAARKHTYNELKTELATITHNAPPGKRAYVFVMDLPLNVDNKID